ncbi:hypothetical protein H1R20_g13126, partial [Candolleomyces eurysporus]
MNIYPDGFLSTKEEKLVHHLLKTCEDSFAWDESEKGIFSGLQPKVIKILKEKQAAGVIELSNAAYQSQWFWVLKKDGKSLWIVHNLQPLNTVTIKDSAVPPTIEPYAESFAGCTCYSVLDLFVGFDQRKLHPDSRNLTTFQSPLGTFQLTRILMGYTNLQQVQHGDLTFILQDEIPHVTMPFIDDVPVRGPEKQYELPHGGYKMIPNNPGIQRFVWEHVHNVLRVVWRVKKAGGMFSGPKAKICVPEAVIPVSKVFLGQLALCRCSFGPDELEAMEKIKILVTQCPTIRPIDYNSDGKVILAVDSSHIAIGYILSQMGANNLRYLSRFGSITWNEQEHCYSQAKIKLFGLLCALKDVRIYIIAVKKLVVKTDTRYIKGMINNPDIQPNATINCWIAGILLFDFELRHIPARNHVLNYASIPQSEKATAKDQKIVDITNYLSTLGRLEGITNGEFAKFL